MSTSILLVSMNELPSQTPNVNLSELKLAGVGEAYRVCIIGQGTETNVLSGRIAIAHVSFLLSGQRQSMLLTNLTCKLEDTHSVCYFKLVVAYQTLFGGKY